MSWNNNSTRDGNIGNSNVTAITSATSLPPVIPIACVTSITFVPSTTSVSSAAAAPAAVSRFPGVASLKARLLDCRGPEEYVAVIRALVATRNPAAIRVLASLLDSTGVIAEESIAGLLTFGEAVIPAMRACVDSLDYDMIRHGHRVLAALGDAASERWLRRDDRECVLACLERVGLSDAESVLWRPVIASDSDEEKESS
jgi:hypothetical protein